MAESKREATWSVPGEDVAWPISLVLLVLGYATCARAFHQVLGPDAVAAWHASAPPSPRSADDARGGRRPEPEASRAELSRAAEADGPRPSAAAVAIPSAAPPPPDCPPLFSVPFGRGEIVPPALDPEKARRLRAWLLGHRDVHLVVQGHADQTGDEVYNLQLSRTRAQAVARALESAGFDAARMTIHAFGAYQPRVGRAGTSPENRRVTLRVTGLVGCPDPEEEGTNP